MFRGMTSLISIDLSGMDITNIEYFDNTFEGDSNLETIIGFDRYTVLKASYIQNMFAG